MTTPASPFQTLASLGRGQSPDSGRRLRIVPEPNFRLGFSPDSISSYEIKDTKALEAVCKAHGVAVPKPGGYRLPEPIVMRLIPGVNGIGTRSRGQSDAQAMSEFNALMAKRRVTVPDHTEPIGDFAPQGADPRVGYLREYPCIDPSNGDTEAVHYASVFMVPYDSGEGEEWRYERELEGLWIMSLIIRGVIPNVSTKQNRLHQNLASERVAETSATAYPTEQGAKNASSRREHRAELVSLPAYRPERLRVAA